MALDPLPGSYAVYAHDDHSGRPHPQVNYIQFLVLKIQDELILCYYFTHISWNIMLST